MQLAEVLKPKSRDHLDSTGGSIKMQK
uniref:Uncharacterized protein n=1 Tax=Anguilla anguilla TaxID=7936 RepID=A0A0E9PXR2_ANGAN